mmetsp:Transcript_11423/g.11397  ORF Transcript_11423/g.11397 Transcript_11423/m.11397 type:complete len:96 (+) Transcript_11423:1250-1537(+)
MKLIEMCEYTRDQEIEARESGRLEEQQIQKKETFKGPGSAGSSFVDSQNQSDQAPKEELNEWEKLQNLPHDQYLAKTVMPVLYQGLKVVSVERPK